MREGIGGEAYACVRSKRRRVGSRSWMSSVGPVPPRVWWPSWRGLPEEKKRRRGRDVVLNWTVSSTAMAGQPVAQKWIDPARLQHVRRSGQTDHGQVSDL